MANKSKTETLRLKAQRAALAKLGHRPILDSAKQHIERGTKK
jgi:hypothetical protein